MFVHISVENFDIKKVAEISLIPANDYGKFVLFLNPLADIIFDIKK